MNPSGLCKNRWSYCQFSWRCLGCEGLASESCLGHAGRDREREREWEGWVAWLLRSETHNQIIKVVLCYRWVWQLHNFDHVIVQGVCALVLQGHLNWCWMAWACIKLECDTKSLLKLGTALCILNAAYAAIHQGEEDGGGGMLKLTYLMTPWSKIWNALASRFSSKAIHGHCWHISSAEGVPAQAHPHRYNEHLCMHAR